MHAHLPLIRPCSSRPAVGQQGWCLEVADHPLVYCACAAYCCVSTLAPMDIYMACQILHDSLTVSPPAIIFWACDLRPLQYLAHSRSLLLNVCLDSLHC